MSGFDETISEINKTITELNKTTEEIEAAAAQTEQKLFAFKTVKFSHKLFVLLDQLVDLRTSACDLPLQFHAVLPEGGDEVLVRTIEDSQQVCVDPDGPLEIRKCPENGLVGVELLSQCLRNANEGFTQIIDASLKDSESGIQVFKFAFRTHDSSPSVGDSTGTPEPTEGGATAGGKAGLIPVYFSPHMLRGLRDVLLAAAAAGVPIQDVKPYITELSHFLVENRKKIK